MDLLDIFAKSIDNSYSIPEYFENSLKFIGEMFSKMMGLIDEQFLSVNDNIQALQNQVMGLENRIDYLNSMVTGLIVLVGVCIALQIYIIYSINKKKKEKEES